MGQITAAGFKRRLIKYIQDFGYQFPDTINDVRRMLITGVFVNVTQACDDASINQVNDFINNHCQGNTNWQRMVRERWTETWATYNDNLRDRSRDDVALYCQVINIALNEQPERDRAEAERDRIRQDNENNTTYAGEEHSAVSFIVNTVEVERYIEIPTYNGGSYPQLKLTDSAGHIYMWSNTKDVPVSIGDRVVGRIYKNEQNPYTRERRSILRRVEVQHSETRNTRFHFED